MGHCWYWVDKILYLFQLKAVAADKIDATQKLKFILRRVENIVGKDGNSSNQYFLLSLNIFYPFNVKSVTLSYI